MGEPVEQPTDPFIESFDVLMATQNAAEAATLDAENDDQIDESEALAIDELIQAGGLVRKCADLAASITQAISTGHGPTRQQIADLWSNLGTLSQQYSIVETLAQATRAAGRILAAPRSAWAGIRKKFRGGKEALQNVAAVLRLHVLRIASLLKTILISLGVPELITGYIFNVGITGPELAVAFEYEKPVRLRDVKQTVEGVTKGWSE